MSMSNSSAVRPKARSAWDTKTLVSMAMLTGIAYIVMLVSKLMPSVMFLDFDFKDVVICIGAALPSGLWPPRSSPFWWRLSR